jgi:protein-S-isoprenylcysteine O-methyltransferase Ste14
VQGQLGGLLVDRRSAKEVGDLPRNPNGSTMLGLFAQVHAVRRRSQSLAKLNLELAKVEVKQKAAALGIAGGMAAAAAAVAFYAIGFGFAAAAAGLAETLSLWLSLLIVAGVLVVVTAILGAMARRYARRASTLQPSQAIEEAKQTVKELQGNG